MTKAADCYFALTHGLQGMYMPDSCGVYHVTRRKDLIAAVREELKFHGAPSRAIYDADWTKIWHHAKRHGLSSTHLCIATGKHTMLELHGLTEAEYEEQKDRDE